MRGEILSPSESLIISILGVLYVGFENVFKLMLYEMMRDYKCLFMFDK
jgi:hypothetical protein